MDIKDLEKIPMSSVVSKKLTLEEGDFVFDGVEKKYKKLNEVKDRIREAEQRDQLAAMDELLGYVWDNDDLDKLSHETRHILTKLKLIEED